MKKYVLFISSLLLSFILGASPLSACHHVYQQVSLEEGLSSKVQSILTSQDGFVWIGTPEGLARFDGHNLKTYTHHPNDPHSIPGDYIYAITEDKLSNLWILTQKGLAIYSHKSDSFSPIVDEEGTIITVSCSCLMPEGIVFGNRSQLYLYEYSTRRIKKWHRIPETLQAKDLDIQKWDDNTMLCYIKNIGCFLMDMSTGKIIWNSWNTPKPSPNKNLNITSIFIDSSQQVWIAMYNKGIKCYSKEGTLNAWYNTSNSALKSNIITCMAEKDGEIWMGTEGGGISILNKQTKQFTTLTREEGENDHYSLPVNAILYLHKDMYQNIWIGTANGGLVYIKEAHMKTFTENSSCPTNGLSDKTIICLFQEKDSPDVWIGTDDGGLNKLNIHTNKITHYAALRRERISSICNLDKEHLLLSVFAKGFYIFNKSTGQAHEFHPSDSLFNNEVLYSGDIIRVYQDEPDEILFLGNSIHKYNIVTKELHRIDKHLPFEIIGNIKPIMKDHEHLYLYTPKQVIRLNTKTDDIEELMKVTSDSTINTATYDENKNIWLGGDHGLMVCDPQTRSHKWIYQSKGQLIKAIQADGNGHIWIGTKHTLISWLIHEESYIIWGESDGQMRNEYANDAHLVSNEGDILLGGTRGLLFINHDLDIKKDDNPKIGIAELQLGKESILNTIADSTIVITWPHKGVKIQVMTKEKDLFRKKAYRFCINNRKECTETLNPSITIRSLKPGNYTIQASCNQTDGNWTPMRPILYIQVNPPWYLSMSFIFTTIILMLSLALCLNYLSKRKQKRKIKWEQKKKEHKLHEEEIQFLINIGHELRTPLTLIYTPISSILNRTKPKDKLYESFKSIHRQVVYMKNLLDSVLSLKQIGLEKDQIQLYPCELNKKLKEFGNDFSMEANLKGVHINYKFSKEVGTVLLDIEKTQIMFYSLINNVLKNNPLQSELNICTELTNGYARVSISNEGSGFNNTGSKGLFSRLYGKKNEPLGYDIDLSYSKILAEAQGGRIGAYINKTKGTTFYFEIPVHKEGLSPSCHPTSYLNELVTLSDEEIYNLQELDQQQINLMTYKIMIVDNNSELTALMHQELQPYFKQTSIAKNGADAFQKIKKQMPDVIISDIITPEMNGFELCKKIKSDINTSHIIVILLTTRTDERTLQTSFKAGADAYITKPCEITTMLALIKNRLYYRDVTRVNYRKQEFLPEPIKVVSNQHEEKFLNDLNKCILNNLDNGKLSISFICKEIGVSRSTLNKRTKAITGFRPNEYIAKIKLEQAMCLLEDTTLSITEISERIGFNTQNYFSSFIKAHTGDAPTRFRKLHKDTRQNSKTIKGECTEN